MSIPTLKFLVIGGPVKAAIDAIYAEKKAILDQIQAEVERFGADHAVGSRGVVGLVFSDAKPAPAGWMKRSYHDEACGKSKTYRFPSRRSKANKEILARWDKLRLPGSEDFQRKVPGTWDLMFTSPGAHGFSFRYFTMYPEKVGNAWILHVPDLPINPQGAQSLPLSGEGKGPRWSPPEQSCVQLKESEYHTMLEAVVERAEAKGGAA